MKQVFSEEKSLGKSPENPWFYLEHAYDVYGLYDIFTEHGIFLK